MVFKEIVFFCTLYFCFSWKIKHDEINKVQELKTKCILQCPFQKQTSDLYIDDITCEVHCKIEHCVKGCHFLEAALEKDCRELCNASNHVNSSLIFCFIGCEQSLKAYFDFVKNEISHLQAPTLVDHTLSSTSLTLEWNETNLMNETYLLQCCNVDLSNSWQFCQNQTWLSHSSVLIQNLQPYTKYQFRVALRLAPGNWYDVYSSSSSIIATSPGGLPTTPPRILTATAISSSIVSVIWEDGQFTNGPLLSYILQVNEEPIGYAGLKDISSTKSPHSCFFKNLKASTAYSIAISARNLAGVGPPATITVKTMPDLGKPKEDIDLMIATEHSVFSVSSNVPEDPVLMYNTTHIIKGIALHIHRELLFISDSSGRVIVTSSKGLLTPQELPISSALKPSALTIDWLSDHLYILSEVLHPSGSVIYEVARCALDGSNLVVVISGFIVKPHMIEVDPYNGYLFWVVRGVGLYRLDLLDISKTINRNVSPDVILEDSNLGAFLINGNSFRIILSVLSQGSINTISLDGQETSVFCEKVEENKFQNVVSLALANGSLFWTNGEQIYQENCDTENQSFIQNITDKLYLQNTKQIIANTPSSQPFPVPVNPPTNFQAIFGHDIAKVSWEKPYGLAGQGEGAWSMWSYRLVAEDKSRTPLFDFSDIKANQYTISSLKPGTEYILKVAAYTFSGEGPWSKAFRGKTLHRNASLLWSNSEGLLLSDVTGYRVTKVEPINYLESDGHFLISDIDWFEDQVFVSTNKQEVFWYNLTSNTHGRIQDINGAKCISVEWLAKKLYWGNTRNKMIFRSSFSGNDQEILPIVVSAESLFLDSYAAYLYWSTKNAVEGACLDGTRRKTFYETKNPYLSEIVGLALDLYGSELYWIEKTSVHPRQSALMIINVKRTNRNFRNDFIIDKFTLINQDTEGGICYIDQHLVWVRSDDKNAMISGLNGSTTALIHSDNLSNLVTCTAVDPFIRTVSLQGGNASEKINVIPNAIQRSSLRIEGSFDSFHIIWDPVTNVNYGKVYYRVKMRVDNDDTLMETNDSSIRVTNKKAYVSIKLIVQSFTYWATSSVVRVTLRSPSSTPSAPTNPRVFVTHKRKDSPRQKEVSVIVRWSPPVHPNGIVQKYELSCWVINSNSNTSGTTCSSSQISAKTLEFTLQNLPSNKTYNFQVRACTDSGCGNWSDVVRTNLQDEISIPKLFLTTNEGLVKLDFDRKSFIIVNVETRNARDIFYESEGGVIFWIERNSVYQSDLNLHLNSINKIAELQTDGVALSYDWIARNLYWVEVNDGTSTIITSDLNRNEEDRRKNILFERRAIIKNIVASPMNSMLFWVELEKAKNTFGVLMRCAIDGSRIKQFFSKDPSFAKNDISSTAAQSTEEIDNSCNWNRSTVGSSIALYPSSPNQYRLLWYDVSSSFIASSDLDGFNCKRVVQIRVSLNKGIPQSITADLKRVYWLDDDETNVYSASLDEPSSSLIEKVPSNMAIRLLKIVAYGPCLQFFPEYRCLWPHLILKSAKVVKVSSDSVVLQMPPITREAMCKNISMATVEYSVYFGAINEDGTSNCTSHLKACSQAVTYDNIKKISKLKPYTKYLFVVGLSNYYSQAEGQGMVLSEPAIYRTAPGIPSAARNVTVTSLTPNSVLVQWQPPEYLNAENVGYSVYRLMKFVNNSEDVREQATWKFLNTSIILNELIPDQEYIIWVKAFPMIGIRPALRIGYKVSENVTVRTFALPSNLTLISFTSHSLNLSVAQELRKLRYELEFTEVQPVKWITLKQGNDKYVEVEGLRPLTTYFVRMRIWYSRFDDAYLWPTNGFEFKTQGDKPSSPGIPVVNYFNEGVYEVTWKVASNFGLSTVVYWLEGQFVDTESDQHDTNTNFSMWILYYNGTDNSWKTNHLKRDTKYRFRVKAQNEYGVSEYSGVSQEYGFESEKLSIVVWMLASVLTLATVTGLSIMFYCSYCTFCRKRRDKKIKDPVSLKSGNLELVNLPEIPAGANSVKTNLLYTTQTTQQIEVVADEFKQIPKIRRDQISLTKFLGCGAFGEVYEGSVRNLLYVNIETKVAIKALRRNATEQEKVEFLKEASLMSNFKHQHILQLLGVCTDNNPHFIIMELMEGGDLLSYLRLNRSSSATSFVLTYLDLLRICCDVASGCCYLEELHFVHRDLACRNCLVSSNDPARRIVKIGDFGLARDIYKNDYYRKEGEGLLPVRWMAPESLVDGVFTCHSDVWSFGVLLWEVMTLGQQPYQARSNVEVLQYVRSGGRLNSPTKCPPQLYELMQKCWNKQPKERPTFVYCLSELEKLRNNYTNEPVNNYTTCLPVCDSII